MQIQGDLLIGRRHVIGTESAIKGINAATGAELEPAYRGAGSAQVEEACALAWAAFDTFRETSLEQRAVFLESIADNIIAIDELLIYRCSAESGLPRAHVEGERGRTIGQLRMFAALVRRGEFLDARIDPALPERTPLPRVDLRLRNIPLGPVAVFGASNFPLAFSVAGGDTASALAAGCPVIVKAHSAHPGTSDLVGQAVQKAVSDCGLPEGTFSLLFSSGHAVGNTLVADPRIKAVGFTGSRSGGIALMKVAAVRKEPIPVYAEMSSINPVLLFPAALHARAESIAKAFVTSLTVGAGQFCTNPGLIIAVDGAGLDRFLETVTVAISDIPAATMLTPGIHQAYCHSVERLAAHPEVVTIGRSREGGPYQGRAALFSTSANAFMERDDLREEMFGAASLLVRCPNLQTYRQILEVMEGQLTASLFAEEADQADAETLLRLLERRVGRIVFNGFGTGVEVGHAMVHGGPYPSTSDGRTTSVGSLAITRFLRPVSYQDMPESLLPPALKECNPLRLRRRIDGVLQDI